MPDTICNKQVRLYWSTKYFPCSSNILSAKLAYYFRSTCFYMFWNGLNLPWFAMLSALTSSFLITSFSACTTFLAQLQLFKTVRSKIITTPVSDLKMNQCLFCIWCKNLFTTLQNMSLLFIVNCGLELHAFVHSLSASYWSPYSFIVWFLRQFLMLGRYFAVTWISNYYL